MALTPNVVAGDKILSSWGNEIRNRTIQVFATAAERASQWVSPPEGAFSILADTGELSTRAGGQWVGLKLPTLLTSGAITTVGGIVLNGDGSWITTNNSHQFANTATALHVVAGKGILYLTSGPSASKWATWGDGTFQMNHNGAGASYNQKNLYLYAAGSPGQPGLSVHDQELGAASLQLFTSSQSTVGFHMVNSGNSGYVSLTASNLTVPSERGLKTDVRDAEIPDAVGAVSALRPVHFSWPVDPLPPPPPAKELLPGEEPPAAGGTTKTRAPHMESLGFLAEDLEAADLPPGILYPPHEGVPATVDVMGMITLLTKAVQELTDRVMALEAGTP